MTVKELSKLLQKLPLEHKVFLSSDEEGNSFSTLICVQEEFFIEGDHNYDHECLHPEDADEDTPKAIVLWP